MNRCDLKQYASFALFPAFTVGIYDGMNPCGLASALIFLLYLSFVGYTQTHVFWLGLLFVVVSAATHFGMALGAFDLIIAAPLGIRFFHVFYFLFAVVFLVVGAFQIIDRWQYGKYFDTRRFKCKVPAFLKSRQKKTSDKMAKRILNMIQFILLAIVVGILITLCSSIYPQREYIFIVYSYLMASGNTKFAIASFLQYGIASALPLIITWVVIFSLGLAREKKGVLLYYKSVSAALFLSVGVGLGCFLLSELFRKPVSGL